MNEPVEESDVCLPRTGLFAVGVLLTGLHALVGWTVGAALVGIAMGELPAVRGWVEARDVGLLDLALSFSGVVGAYYLALSTLQLIACAAAWFGSRGWTWGLLLLALAGLPCSGPVSFVVAVVTVLGAMQVLDQSRPFPKGEGVGVA